MRITVEMLKAKGACRDDLQTFATEWPNGCEVTEATLLRAAELGLALHWFAQHLLPAPLLDEYERQIAPFRAEYAHKMAALWDEYRRQIPPFRDDYERKVAPFLDEHRRKVTPLRAEYERQLAPLLAEYNRQAAATIGRLMEARP